MSSVVGRALPLGVADPDTDSCAGILAAGWRGRLLEVSKVNASATLDTYMLGLLGAVDRGVSFRANPRRPLAKDCGEEDREVSW